MASSRRRKSSRTTRNHSTENQLRIIGGQWRGRKLRFPDAPGLRPTPDRVRETLFNWLSAIIPGTRCLDLFAGSGALSLEALSRGAASATMIDCSRQAVEQLQVNLQLLQGNGRIIQQSAKDWLASPPSARFDVVFLDPPFGQDLLKETIEQMGAHDILADDAWVYVESGISESLPALPPHWSLHREKQAGQVCYRLFHCRQHC